MAFALPWGIWNLAPSLWAKEWFIPKKAFANAIPAIQEALCIFSLASLHSAESPPLYDIGKYLNTISIAFKPIASTYAVTIFH